jgi:hypothetical protein
MGNMPAMDVINIPENEKDTAKDFSLSFIGTYYHIDCISVLIFSSASGDLRHVMVTTNALPSNYSGKLTLLINDLSPPTICRNVTLLLILGTISDKILAADVALHFWYSLFLPSEYSLRISTTLFLFLEHIRKNGAGCSHALGPCSMLSVWISPQNLEFFKRFISPSISVDDAQDEYDRVRTAPSREDFRERMYSGLRPSHRLAFQIYRRFGIVLPFGAPNAHFNSPNPSLFSLDGEWLQTDYADPLEGWE